MLTQVGKHLAHRCRCGRTMHWPHTAKVGDTWTCRYCKRTSRLVPHNTPGAESGVNLPSWGHAGPIRPAPRPSRPVHRQPSTLGDWLTVLFGGTLR